MNKKNAEETFIGPDARAMVGAETPWGMPFEVEKGAVLRFARSIGDKNPLYIDEVYARAIPPGRIPVPEASGFFDFNMESGHEREITWRIPLPLVKRVRVKDEYEMLRPIYVGDAIQARSRVLDIYEKEGRTGRIIFILAETEYRNQNGAVVMRHRITSVRR